LLLPGGASSGGTKGKTERKTWAIYSWVHLGEGVRVWGRGGASAALGAAVLEEESEPEEGDDRWGQGVSGEREGPAYHFRRDTGWAVGRILAWDRFGPAAFYFFLFFFFFLFSVFLFSFVTFANQLQKASNQNPIF
jgi:hypothetical protein